MKTKIIEKAIPENLFKNLQDTLTCASTVPFYYYAHTTLARTEKNYELNTSNKGCLMDYQWVNTLYHPDTGPTSKLWDPVYDVLVYLNEEYSLGIASMFRAKLNVLTASMTPITHLPHIDTELEGYTTIVIYLNDSSGDTVLFKEVGPKAHNKYTEVLRVTPEAGKILIFDSNIFHASSVPTTNKVRYLLNIMFKTGVN